MSAIDSALHAASVLEEPIRAELFGIERLEQHAESLAAAARTTEIQTQGRPLLSRVRENERVLLDAYHDVVRAVGEKSEITLADEWFLDNFHVVDEQLREIRDHLPESYYRALPKIAAGHLAGTPRVYGLAWAYVSPSARRAPCAGLPGAPGASSRPSSVTKTTPSDGSPLPAGALLPLCDDGSAHGVEVLLG